MITPWDVYWITRLDGIIVAATLVIIVTSVASGILALLGGLEGWYSEGWFRKWIVRSVIALCVSGLIACFVPCTKTAVAIYMIPKIANNEQVQKLPDNAMKFLNGKFEEWINDMADKKKGK